jgi:dTDP-4-amino-4,6-dideoxygalactose transaminase
VVSAQNTQRILLNDFVAQWRDVGADAVAALERVGASGWLILGSEVKGFEAELARYWGVPEVVGCASGLDAIEIALRALGLAPGDKVLTTPLSAFATSLAIVRAGGVPVVVDVDAAGQLDLELAARALRADAAIRFCLPVHLFGHALDARRLAELAALPVRLVEDCAQACGAASRGVPVGATGAAAATSFYPTKNLGAMGDGGALLTGDAALAAEARSLRDYGQTAKYVHARLGMNSRLDELHAAILRSALLPRLPGYTQRRVEIAAAYRRGIEHRALTLPPAPEGSESVWHLFPVLVDGARDAFMAHLGSAGIGSGVHYPTLIPDQPAFTGVRYECKDPLAQARRFAHSEVSLPIHPYLTDEQVERVIAACNSWKP